MIKEHEAYTVIDGDFCGCEINKADDVINYGWVLVNGNILFLNSHDIKAWKLIEEIDSYEYIIEVQWDVEKNKKHEARYSNMTPEECKARYQREVLDGFKTGKSIISIDRDSFTYLNKNCFDLRTDFTEEEKAEIKAEARKRQAIEMLSGEDGSASKSTPKTDNRPKCPTCGSHDIRKIDGLERGVSVIGLGLFSKKINKTYKCNNCGHTW